MVPKEGRSQRDAVSGGYAVEGVGKASNLVLLAPMRVEIAASTFAKVLQEADLTSRVIIAFPIRRARNQHTP